LPNLQNLAPSSPTTIQLAMPQLSSTLMPDSLPALNLNGADIEIRAKLQSAPAVAEMPDAVFPDSDQLRAPLADEDILRWRTTAARTGSATSNDGAGWNDLFSKLRLSDDATEVDHTQTDATGLSLVGLDPRFVSPHATTVDSPGTAASVTSAPLGSAPLIRQMPVPSPSGQPIQVPTGDLNYEERAAAFSEQVGRRIMDNIRIEKWEVKIRLDPENLGPLDIRLDVDGNNVSAMFGVNSADVQSLLEQGLSKLRNSFESSGYTLNAWNFDSSNAGSSSSRRDKTAAAALAPLDEPAARKIAVAKNTALAARASSSSASAIDLFV
jgi:flagellar hook-length control protein FliK